MTDREFVDPLAHPSVTRAMEVGRYKPVGGVGLAAATLIGLAEVADLLDTWADWHRYQVVRDYVAGDSTVTPDSLRDADSISSATTWGYLIALTAAGVMFLVWLWRARQNAEVLCVAAHRRSRGWVVWSWICPVVNLWFPFMIVDDVYRASRRDNLPDLVDLRSVRGSVLLGWWWALWLAATVPGWIVIRALRDDVTVESFHTVAIADTFGVLLSIGAAVLIIRIMREISAWQTPVWTN